MAKTAKVIKEDRMKAKRANLKAARNSKIKGQPPKGKKESITAESKEADKLKFDEVTIKKNIAAMLEEYKKAGGAFELGGEDDEMVDGSDVEEAEEEEEQSDGDANSDDDDAEGASSDAEDADADEENDEEDDDDEDIDGVDEDEEAGEQNSSLSNEDAVMSDAEVESDDESEENSDDEEPADEESDREEAEELAKDVSGDEDQDEIGAEETEAKKKERKEQREKRKFDFERNDRTIFIGNLPSTYDHRDVVKLFKSCGPVESARIRSVIPEKEKLSPKVAQITKKLHPKVNSVNAYLVFEKHDDNETHIKKALSLNGKLVDEHHIRVDRAQHPNSKRMTLTSRKKSVFVGNLRFDIRDDDLIKHFEKVGPVDYVRLVRDKATGLGKGFGFVKFEERAAVKKALELNETQFQGRSLRIKKVDEKALKMGEEKSKRPAGQGESKFEDAQRKHEENQGFKRAKIETEDDDDDNDEEDDEDGAPPKKAFKVREQSNGTKRGGFNNRGRGAGMTRPNYESRGGFNGKNEERGGKPNYRGGRPGGNLRGGFGRGGPRGGGFGRGGFKSDGPPGRGGFRPGGINRGGHRGGRGGGFRDGGAGGRGGGGPRQGRPGPRPDGNFSKDKQKTSLKKKMGTPNKR